LAEEEFPKKEQELPRDLVLMNRAGVFEILWCKRNWKSLKKWIFCGLKYRTVPIISADDDCLYKCNYAEELLHKYISTRCPIITFNMVTGWCKTEGPCTLYHPNRNIFVPRVLSKYVDGAQDDGIISEVIDELRIKPAYCVSDENAYPFVFHTTDYALNPLQYQEPKYKKCIISSR
jgi:hypothetical protein